MAKVQFVCVSCGEELPSRLLSKASFELSGAMTRRDAVEVMERPVCTLCEQDEVEVEYEEPEIGERTELELFEYSGLLLDGGMQTFIAMNW